MSLEAPEWTSVCQSLLKHPCWQDPSEKTADIPTLHSPLAEKKQLRNRLVLRLFMLFLEDVLAASSAISRLWIVNERGDEQNLHALFRLSIQSSPHDLSSNFYTDRVVRTYLASKSRDLFSPTLGLSTRRWPVEDGRLQRDRMRLEINHFAHQSS